MPSIEADAQISKDRLEFSKEDWDEWMDWEQEATPLTRSSRVKANGPSGRSGPFLQAPKTPNFSSDHDEDIADKSKVSATDDAKVGQERSHSVAEKRYRENLNQKIAELGECIPKLRTNAKPSTSQVTDGATPKRNKAKVLTEAMSYIRELEKRNAYLEKANTSMKGMMQRQTSSRSSWSEANPPDESVSEAQEEPPKESTSIEEGTAHVEPKGMIPIPEAMRRLWNRDDQNQEHYADSMREPK